MFSLMTDPVRLPSGHVVDKPVIMRHILRYDVSGVTLSQSCKLESQHLGIESSPRTQGVYLVWGSHDVSDSVFSLTFYLHDLQLPHHFSQQKKLVTSLKLAKNNLLPTQNRYPLGNKL